MKKKQKQPVVGTKEYYDQLIKHYAGRATWLVQRKGNLSQDDLEYLMVAASKLKDERLKQCIAELVGWGDEERAELETLLALGFEAMKLCSPSRMREAAMRVSLKYYLKELNNGKQQEAGGGGGSSGAANPSGPGLVKGAEPAGTVHVGGRAQPSADATPDHQGPV